MLFSQIILLNLNVIRTIKWQRLIIILLGYTFIRQLKQKKSRVRETKHLSTDADSSTDTTNPGFF